jgi:hypothetical protein
MKIFLDQQCGSGAASSKEISNSQMRKKFTNSQMRKKFREPQGNSGNFTESEEFFIDNLRNS